MRTGNVSPAPATRTMGGPASHVHTEPFSIAQAACSEVTRARKPPALHICARTGRDSQIASRPVSDESRLTASGPVSFTSASVRSRRGWHHPPSNVPQSLLANEALAPPTSPRCPNVCHSHAPCSASRARHPRSSTRGRCPSKNRTTAPQHLSSACDPLRCVSCSSPSLGVHAPSARDSQNRPAAMSRHPSRISRKGAPLDARPLPHHLRPSTDGRTCRESFPVPERNCDLQRSRRCLPAPVARASLGRLVKPATTTRLFAAIKAQSCRRRR